ncbi:Dot/Icm system substrate protein LidA [Legionella lansingensis]|uniref:Dot/Icm system substrate protein LidA n=1 Tax=Legionella lansingensis TaxID=45067 RepID=A0A0W0VS70_9GAMM|nr:hypothetical protein [Legionella lansingensis]KTD22999.1 Dot/Icm system substrate protein LidA [Legionella lansingensis]SNV51293.1 Dot/Icm system substrate protein LidA [Legionella lansingensis]
MKIDDFEKEIRDIAKFGLQTTKQVIEFFHTKVGEALLETFREERIKEEEMREAMFLQAQEEQEELAMLLSEMAAEKEEKEKELMLRGQDEPPPPPKAQEEPTKEKDKAKIGRFDHEIDYLNSQLEDVKQEITKATEKYENYDKNLKNVDDTISKLESETKNGTREDKIKAIEDEISKLEGTKEERDEKAQAIFKLIDDGLKLGGQEGEEMVAQAKKELEELNAKNLQIGTLKDMLAVTKGDKIMYKSNGETTTSFQEADFVVPKDKQLVKEGEEFYLLNQGEKLSDENRTTAKQDFDNAKGEMSSVKNLVSSNRSIEMGELDQKVKNLSDRITQLQTEKSQEDKRTTQTGPMMSSLSDTTNQSSNDLKVGGTGQQKTTSTQTPSSSETESFKI